MSDTYPTQVLQFIGDHAPAMQAMDSPSVSVLQHVSQHTADGEIRLDRCPCPRGVDGLPTDEIGRPVIDQLGDGQYVSSVRHTLADLVRDVIEGG
jgi:hypothetical protein